MNVIRSLKVIEIVIGQVSTSEVSTTKGLTVHAIFEGFHRFFFFSFFFIVFIV